MKNSTSANYYPYVAEKWSIDSLNALSAAEIGVRSQRGRGFFTKVLDFFTGDDVELQAQIDADIITSQKVILNVVKQLIFDESRTKYCLLEVSKKLHLVVDKLNKHNTRIHELDMRLSNAESILNELSETISNMYDELNVKISQIDFRLRRSDISRHLSSHFRAGRLHENLGFILSAALYIAQISNLFALEPEHASEVGSAKSEVLAKLTKDIAPIEDILLSDLSNVPDDFFEIIGYVTSKNENPLCVIINMMARRKLAHLANTADNINELINIARLYDEFNFINRNILSSPYSIAVQLASELVEREI